VSKVPVARCNSSPEKRAASLNQTTQIMTYNLLTKEQYIPVSAGFQKKLQIQPLERHHRKQMIQFIM